MFGKKSRGPERLFIVAKPSMMEDYIDTNRNPLASRGTMVWKRKQDAEAFARSMKNYQTTDEELKVYAVEAQWDGDTIPVSDSMRHARPTNKPTRVLRLK